MKKDFSRRRYKNLKEAKKKWRIYFGKWMSNEVLWGWLKFFSYLCSHLCVRKIHNHTLEHRSRLKWQIVATKLVYKNILHKIIKDKTLLTAFVYEIYKNFYLYKPWVPYLHKLVRPVDKNGLMEFVYKIFNVLASLGILNFRKSSHIFQIYFALFKTKFFSSKTIFYVVRKFLYF